MALFFKCPKCGRYYMDMFGEFAAGRDLMDADSYKCPKCKVILESVDEDAYHAAPDDLQYDIFNAFDN